MSKAAVSENIGCSAAVIVFVLVVGWLISLKIRQPPEPDPSIECVKVGGNWVAFHCERAR